MFALTSILLSAAMAAETPEPTPDADFPSELPSTDTEWEAHKAQVEAQSAAAAAQAQLDAAQLELAEAQATLAAQATQAEAADRESEEDAETVSLDEPTTASDARLERVTSNLPLPKVGVAHGFRIGYSFMKLDGTDNDPLKSGHLFTVGYEVQQRIIGGGWLNVLMVENIMVSGINQSKFIPTANLLLGFEFKEQLQVGAGINLSPFSEADDLVHMVMGVGYTPQVGSFNVPLHASFIPDVDGNWRAQLTTGVNW